VNELGDGLVWRSRGYSSIGAVIGATFPEEGSRLRSLMPKALILVPGYGAQGGSAKAAAECFNEDWPRRARKTRRAESLTHSEIRISRAMRCALGSRKHNARDRRSERRSEDHYWCTAVNRVCAPATPLRLNVSGTRSLSATSGTTNIELIQPTKFGARPE